MLPQNRRQNSNLRALNQPQPVEVTALGETPAFVRRGGREVPVLDVRDHWRIDDRWWTESPVSRDYWELELEGGLVVTVFRDNEAGLWFEQRTAQ